MKSKLVLFVTGYIFLIFSSCLNSDEVEYEISRDPQIASFSLSSDSISGLSSVVFTIDQVEGLIYNRDSLPYGTDVSEKVLVDMTFSTSIVSEVEMVSQAAGDTVYFRKSTENDSIHFSKPVDIKITAADGFTTKRYLAKLNVHQVFPDTMIWNLYAQNAFPSAISDLKVVVFPYQGNNYNFIYTYDGTYHLGIAEMPASGSLSFRHQTSVNLPSSKLSQLVNFRDMLVVPGSSGELYISEDGLDWQDKGLSYSVVSILGEIKPESNDLNTPLLCVIIKEDDKYYFAALNESLEFVTEGSKIVLEEIPAENFPVEGFGSVSYSAGYYARLLVVAGKDLQGNLLNSSWMTTNGTVWTKQNTKDYFDPKSGVMTTHYDDKIYMLGGLVQGSTQTNDIYCSPDRGVSWALADTTVVMPPADVYKPRGYGSILVDDENFMFIFGGKEQETSQMLNEIWKGRINRLGFKD